MYSYIVVDDEMLIRKGLIRKIDSITSMEFECVGEAGNGLQGMELVKEKNPDIVITDMKMNRMSGIEFLDQLGEEFPDKPAIVISGYKDFNYVKKAIENRVIGYVLKPFSTEEIEKQLLDAAARIEQKQNVEKLKEKIVLIEQRKSCEILRSAIMEPWSEMLEEEIFNKGYLKNGTFQLIIIYAQEKELIGEIEKVCSKVLQDVLFYIFENPLFKRQYFILIQTNNEQKEKFSVLSERLLHSLQAEIETARCYICVTDFGQKVSHLNRAYKQAEKLIRYVPLEKEKTLLKINGEKCRKPEEYSSEYVQTVFREIKYHKNQTKEIMNRFFEEIFLTKKTLADIGIVCENLISKVNEYAIKRNVDTDDIMGVFYHRYLFCDDMEKMKREISGYVSLIMQSVEMKESRELNLADQMVVYIQENLYKKLTIQDISEKFYITPTVCSHVLKEKLGESFNEYISKLRIEKAKSLLKDTNLSIESISEEIGYANPKYFFKIFKKMVLCTPLEFRNRSKDVEE